jgi:hypothetical protein
MAGMAIYYGGQDTLVQTGYCGGNRKLLGTQGEQTVVKRMV